MVPPVEPTTAAAAASAAGAGAMTGGMNLLGTIASSAFNAWQSSKNRQFQRFMSDTSHQREVADLRAAGLNPLLSVKHGGASTPGGSAAQVAESRIGSETAAGAQVAAQMELLKAQTGDVNSAKALKDAQASDIYETRAGRLEANLADVRLKLAQAGLSSSQRDQLAVQARQLESQIRLANAQAANLAADSEKKKLIGSAFQLANEAAEGVRGSLFRRKGPPNKEEIPLRRRIKKFFRPQSGGASGRY